MLIFACLLSRIFMYGACFIYMMDRIIEHIERLLLRHDCVIIPDFGGFVLQSVSAVYIEEENSFIPARKEIVFNPTLTHNDGLLVESYMGSYSADFNKAQQIVKKDIAAMRQFLDEYSELQLGSIGLFIKENERLIFIQEKNNVTFSTSSYGFTVFHYIPLSARNYVGTTPEPVASEAQLVVAEKQNKNVIYKIPVTRTFLRAVASIAAVILLFLLISTPVGDVNKASYSASFVPQEIMPKKTVDDIVSGAFSDADDMAVSVDKLEYVPELEVEKAKNDISDVKSDDKEKVETVKPVSKNTLEGTETKTASAKSPPSSTGGEKYYVIIGSFKSKTHAQAHIKELKKSSKVMAAANVLVTDRARIYARSFSNERDANSYMNELHQNTIHKDAWVYKAN